MRPVCASTTFTATLIVVRLVFTPPRIPPATPPIRLPAPAPLLTGLVELDHVPEMRYRAPIRRPAEIAVVGSTSPLALSLCSDRRGVETLAVHHVELAAVDDLIGEQIGECDAGLKVAVRTSRQAGGAEIEHGDPRPRGIGGCGAPNTETASSAAAVNAKRVRRTIGPPRNAYVGVRTERSLVLSAPPAPASGRLSTYPS